jgi:hypothetical protein
MLGRAPPAGRRQKSIGKIKPLFTQSHLPASAHPLPPYSRWCPRLGSARPPAPLAHAWTGRCPQCPTPAAGPRWWPPARKKEEQTRPTPPPPLGLLSCLCCLGAAGHACQLTQNRLSRGFPSVAPNGPTPSCAACPRIGKTKGIFVRVPRKRALAVTCTQYSICLSVRPA